MKKQENRNTVIEKDIENLKEFKESANHRLDSHDEQNKAILVLAEQVKKCVKRCNRKDLDGKRWGQQHLAKWKRINKRYIDDSNSIMDYNRRVSVLI